MSLFDIFRRIKKPGLDFAKFEKIGNFRVSSKISIGGIDEEIRLEVLPGEYRCYFLSSDIYEDYYDELERQGKKIESYFPDQLILIHPDFEGSVKDLYQGRSRIGSFDVEGAQFVAFDSEMNGHKEFMDDLIYEGMGIVRDRGVRISLNGDTTAEIFSMESSGRIVGICIDAKA
jgi:hypothetical protein